MKYTLLIDTYIGYPITPDYVREQLAPTNGQPATVLINSLGGSLDTALNIRQQFIDHGAVTVHFTGLSASAATILAMGAKHITMSPHALILLHQCRGYSETWGYYNRDELQTAIDDLKKQQTDLDAFDRVVASIYATRAGTDPKQMAALMAEERWLTADEALQLGLIDEISEAPGDATPTAITAATRTHIVACGYPLPPGGDASQRRTQATNTPPTWVATLIHSIRDLLHPTTPTTTNIKNQTQMEQTHPITAEHITALLSLQGLEANAEGRVTLTVEQVQAIDTHIAQAQATAKSAQEAQAAAEAKAKEAEATLARADGDDTTPALPADQTQAPVTAGIAAAQFFQKFSSVI